MRRKEHMHMIYIVVPFLKCDVVIGLDVLEDDTKSGRNLIRYNFSPVLYNKNHVIVHWEYRMVVSLKIRDTTLLSVDYHWMSVSQIIGFVKRVAIHLTAYRGGRTLADLRLEHTLTNTLPIQEKRIERITDWLVHELKYVDL